MPRITISYRHADSAAITGRIFDRLVARYGAGNVFIDTDRTMPAGTDFRRYIERMLERSDVLLAVVGRAWAGPHDDGVRIAEPNDPVRVEVATAMRFDLAIIPVLAEGAEMPSAAQLPEDVRNFVDRHALHIDSGDGFEEQVRRVIRAVDEALSARRYVQAEAKWQAREARKRSAGLQPPFAPAAIAAPSGYENAGKIVAAILVLFVCGACVLWGVTISLLSNARAIPSPSPVFETASPDPVARAGGNGKRFHRPMPADFFVLSEDTPGLYAGFVDCKPAGEDADVTVEVVNDYRQVAHFDLSLRPSSHWTWPWDRDWLRERPHIQPGARWRAVHRVKGLDCSRDIRFDVGDLDFNDP